MSNVKYDTITVSYYALYFGVNVLNKNNNINNINNINFSYEQTCFGDVCIHRMQMYDNYNT